MDKWEGLEGREEKMTKFKYNLKRWKKYFKWL